MSTAITDHSFWNTPAARQLREAADAEVLAKRKQAAAAIETIEAEAEKRAPAAAEAVESALAKLQTARAVLAACERELNAAQKQRAAVTLKRDLESGPHLRVLRDTADERLGPLLDQLYAAAAGQDRTPECVELLVECRDRLWRLPLSHDELTTRIAEIRAQAGLEDPDAGN